MNTYLHVGRRNIWTIYTVHVHVKFQFVHCTSNDWNDLIEPELCIINLSTKSQSSKVTINEIACVPLCCIHVHVCDKWCCYISCKLAILLVCTSLFSRISQHLQMWTAGNWKWSKILLRKSLKYHKENVTKPMPTTCNA